MTLTTTQTIAPEGVLGRMEEHEHEEVLFCYDRATGLRAIIAVHDTTLGPGARRHPHVALRERDGRLA